MKSPRIALFVADPVRDIPGIVLTAFELCQRGAECFVVPFRGGHADICALAPDFVLLPAIRPYQVWMARQYVEAGIQIGFLDAEGVVWSSMDEYKNTIWADVDLTRELACVCAWSPEVADYMIRNGVFTEGQVAVSGCPRFDFYSEPLSAVYQQGLAPFPRPDRKMVLINTNFTIANPDHGSPKLVIERLVENYGYDVQEVRRWHDNEVASIDRMAELANNLAKDVPEMDIVFRPHPQELLGTYESKLEKVPNLKLTNGGSVTAWILRSSAVIQRSCTTAIEATLAHRLALSPQWIAPSNYYPIPESVSVACGDYNQLKAVLIGVRTGEFQLPEEDQSRISSIVESAFFRTDGLAHRRVAEAVLNSLTGDSQPALKKCRRFLYGLPDKSSHPFSKLSNRVRYHLRMNPTYAFRRMKAFNERAPSGFPDAGAIAALAQAITEAKEAENPERVQVYPACGSGAYITSRHSGSAVVMRRSN